MNLQKIIDLGGHVRERGTVCLAEQDLPDGLLLIFYRTDHDIKELIKRLSDQPGINSMPQLLTIDFWTAVACDKAAGDQCFRGDCPPRPPDWEPGYCQPESIGNYRFCSCEYVMKNSGDDGPVGCC